MTPLSGSSTHPSSVQAAGASDVPDGASPDDGGPIDSPWGPGLAALGPIGTERRAREHALVLQSMSLRHAMRWTPHGWYLLVTEDSVAAAAAAIERYDAENRDWPPPRPRERLRFPSSPWAPLAFVALAAFFFVTGPSSAVSRWHARGSSVADLVLSHQPWRAVTALTLHADAAHVMGNVLSGAIFTAFVHRRLGPGGGTLAVLAAGVLGNVANAVFHHVRGNPHGSIGASTAVFGAIGILAATQLVVDGEHRTQSAVRPRWLEIAAPVVGGLALLGALGASPRADLGAHLFGLVAGGLVGLLGAWLVRVSSSWRPRWWLQPLLGATAVGFVLGAWQLAIRA